MDYLGVYVCVCVCECVCVCVKGSEKGFIDEVA